MHAERHGDEVRVKVTDTGYGIPEQDRDRIFEEFQSGSNVRPARDGGFGLGLFIVKSVVKGHRGTVSADSAGPQQGTTITVMLPGVMEQGYEEAAASA